MEESGHEFDYMFGNKEDLLIVLLQGKIAAKDLPVVEQCESEILEKTEHVILFFFRDVASILPAAFPTLARMQKAIRDKGKVVGICSLKPEIKTALLQAGIIRESEVFNNIPEAVKKIKARSQ